MAVVVRLEDSIVCLKVRVCVRRGRMKGEREERIISLTLWLTRRVQKAHLTTMTVVVRPEDSIVCLKVRVREESEGIRRRNERRERRVDHLTYTGAHSMFAEGSPHYNDCRCMTGGFHCMPEGTCVCERVE